MGKAGANAVKHFNFHSHSLWDNEDIRENDCGIYEVLVAVDGLDREGRRNLWIATALEKVMLAFCFFVLGKIATGCFEAVSLNRGYDRSVVGAR